MTEIPLYQVDSFTNELFSGNPAAVCILENPLSDHLMQLVAGENNLSETAFVDVTKTPFFIRWFTPTHEVDLCGHATLAAARIIFDQYLSNGLTETSFSSNSGILLARKCKDFIYLDFPRDNPLEVTDKSLVSQALRESPSKLLKGKDDLLAIFECEEIIRSIHPDLNIISSLKSRGLIISAAGIEEDFVSRCFFPQFGVDEDPVTGSAHTLLTPYWSKVLGKDKLTARQISKRSGYLKCELLEDRVLIGGATVRYLQGKIKI